MINIIPTLTVMDTMEEYKTMILNYISTGSRIFRCNATRFTNEIYLESINTLRTLYSKETGEQFDLLLDIPYPKDKFRVEFIEKENQIQINKHQLIKIVFFKEEMTDNNMLYAGDIQQHVFSIGDKIIIGDGDILLKVTAIFEKYIECIAENKGEIGYRKACYFGDKYCHKTDRDSKRKYFELIELLSPEYIALSFVESAKEVMKVKDYLENKSISSKIIAKIESQKAIENLGEIIKVSDGVLLGRGDLALSSGYAMLPINQKQFFDLCNHLYCATYVATDILNSLRNSNFPTRAEVCDLYSLIRENAENIILSGPLCRYEKYLAAAQVIRDVEREYGIQCQKEGRPE